jgi:hypothetical protein
MVSVVVTMDMLRDHYIFVSQHQMMATVVTFLALGIGVWWDHCRMDNVILYVLCFLAWHWGVWRDHRIRIANRKLWCQCPDCMDINIIRLKDVEEGIGCESCSSKMQFHRGAKPPSKPFDHEWDSTLDENDEHNDVDNIHGIIIRTITVLIRRVYTQCDGIRLTQCGAPAVRQCSAIVMLRELAVMLTKVKKKELDTSKILELFHSYLNNEHAERPLLQSQRELLEALEMMLKYIPMS